jgi:hypothetical protein
MKRLCGTFRDTLYLNPNFRDTLYLNPNVRGKLCLNPNFRDTLYLNPNFRDTLYLNPNLGNALGISTGQIYHHVISNQFRNKPHQRGLILHELGRCV